MAAEICARECSNAPADMARATSFDTAPSASITRGSTLSISAFAALE
jgi:hypothetical protein